MRHILITGINGFVGKHLAHELFAKNIMVYGCGLDADLDGSLNDIVSEFTANCDLTKVKDVSRLPLDKVDAVINLAGLAQVGNSFGNEDLYNKINVGVHTTLANAIQKKGRAIRMISISTGAVYDNHQTMPLNETSQLIKEGSPYALSKIAMEEALQEYINSDVDIVIARPFNHIGPGQLPGFLVPDLAQQVIASNAISVGNLKTERDYTDVRDVVKAYAALATRPKLSYHIYNICSGASTSGQTILDYILDAADKTDITVSVDPKKVRPNDPALVVGDNSRIRQETGWKPSIQLKQTVTDFVNAAKRS